MRRFLVFSLCFFLIVDLLLAAFIFKPALLSRIFKGSVTIVTAVPSTNASLTNAKYLNRKLDELGFWDDESIYIYEKTIRKVTVNRLVIEFTDKPQDWGVFIKSVDNPMVLLSYGRQYDAKTQSLRLIVQANPSLSPDVSFDHLYSNSLLLALFDLTYPPTGTLIERDKKLQEFMSDFPDNPANSSFVHFKKI